MQPELQNTQQTGGFMTQHPYIFWGLVIFLVLLLIYIVYGMMSSSSASTSSSSLGSTTSVPPPASTGTTIGTTIGTTTGTPTATPATFTPLPGCASDPNAPGYSFCQGMDSNGGDIGSQGSLANNVSGLVSYCNSMPNCVGFNTNSYIKGSLAPQSQWVKWTTDPTKGLYVKGQENFRNPGQYGRPSINPFD